jgi:hypothetical protein
MIKSRIRNAGHLTRMGDKKIPKRVLVRYSEGNRPLGRPGLRWEDNIKMNVKEKGEDGVDWINLVRDKGEGWAVVNAVLTLRFPQNAGHFFTG